MSAGTRPRDGDSPGIPAPDRAAHLPGSEVSGRSANASARPEPANLRSAGLVR